MPAEAGTGASASNPARRLGSPSSGEGVGLLAAASLYAPLSLLATNPGMGVRAHSLVAVVVALLLCGYGVVLAGVRLGGERRVVVYRTTVALLAVSFGGGVATRIGGWAGLLSTTALTALAMAIIGRVRSLKALDVVMFWIGCFLVLNPLAQALAAHRPGASEASISDDSPLAIEFRSKPDTLVMILDGYGGASALERHFRFSNDRVVSDLVERGFRVPESAWSAYPMTHVSVPSFFDMDYPLMAGAEITPAVRSQLHAVIGGANRVVATFKAQGYRFTMVEAGWGGSRCGEAADTCVGEGWFNDSLYALATQSLAADAVDDPGRHPFTIGALRTMQWLEAQLPAIAANGEPDLVFAHVLLPHHPFVLGDDCRIREASIDEDETKRAYLAQVRCVNAFATRVVDLLSVDSVVVLAGDHGTSTLAFPTIPDPQVVAERLSVFLAVRLSPECLVPDPVILPNVMRLVLECLSGASLPALDPRMFTLANAIDTTVPEVVVEVPPHVVVRLLGG